MLNINISYLVSVLSSRPAVVLVMNRHAVRIAAQLRRLIGEEKFVKECIAPKLIATMITVNVDVWGLM